MSESFDSERLGILVRTIWIAWAKEQPNPKASWLVPWEELSEPDKEVDRRIGMGIAALVTHEREAALRAALAAREGEVARLTAHVEYLTDVLAHEMVNSAALAAPPGDGGCPLGGTKGATE